MEASLVRHADVFPVLVTPLIQRRTLAYGIAGMMIETTFEAGAELAVHSHPQEQITYVVEGELELTVGANIYTLGRGDSLCVPGGASHRGLARLRTVAVDLFAPPREDFKQAT
jgi:quercetin dioxygenase-like cupin family protein